MFNKKLKAELQDTKDQLKRVEEDLIKTKDLLNMYRGTSHAKELIEEAKKECRSQADFNRVKLLERSMYDINYRSYITKTASGRICIDFNQIPLSDLDVSQLLNKE